MTHADMNTDVQLVLMYSMASDSRPMAMLLVHWTRKSTRGVRPCVSRGHGQGGGP